MNKSRSAGALFLAALLSIFLVPAQPARAASAGDLELVAGCYYTNPEHTMRYESNGRWTPFTDVTVNWPGPSLTTKGAAVARVGFSSHTVALDANGNMWHAVRPSGGLWTPFNAVEPFAGSHAPFQQIAATSVGADLWVVASTTHGAYLTIRTGATGLWSPFDWFYSVVPEQQIIDLGVTWVYNSDVYPFITRSDGGLRTGALRGGTLINQWDISGNIRSASADSTRGGMIHLTAVTRSDQVVHQALPRLGQWTGWRDVEATMGFHRPANTTIWEVATGVDSLDRAFVTARAYGPGGDVIWNGMRRADGYWTQFAEPKNFGAGQVCRGNDVISVSSTAH
ncbi:hypothetical protein ACFQS1_17665 [Paractinoplanes rhizophilus]|uniref:Uncharacterized protein n=1 Tax=Paractinoplanes rhizophilus TaxID=1416877 RepID=A0ABW2HT54_9ACTN|nr:hypothetical protein [Actinoplanes sp.]